MESVLERSDCFRSELVPREHVSGLHDSDHGGVNLELTLFLDMLFHVLALTISLGCRTSGKLQTALLGLRNERP